jgi:polyphosphate kinase 2 (PPK2 family)
MAKNKIRLADLTMGKHGKDKAYYEQRVAELQLQMLRIQQAYYRQRRRGILVFEGWDAAGKGGAIRRLTEKVDPRGCQVHAIGAPTKVEQGTHYLYRFWKALPAPGNIAVFDRSWYGRVLVERVEGFAEKSAWSRAYDEINEFEGLLVDDGVRIAKFFIHISKEEQARRFAERALDPYKRWKLKADDFRNRGKWAEYESAIEDMFEKTSTAHAPWSAIGGDYKWYVRARVLEEACAILGQGIDLSMPVLDPEVRALAEAQLGVDFENESVTQPQEQPETGETTKKKKKKKAKKKVKGAKAKKSKGKKKKAS